MSSQIRFFVFLLFGISCLSNAVAQTCTYGSIVTEQYASSATGVNYWGGTTDGTKGAPDGNPSSIYATNNASYQIIAQYDKTFSAGTKIKITARYYSAYYSGNLVLAFSENGVTYTANTSAVGGFNANTYNTVTYTLPATMTGNYKYIRVRGSDATSLMFIDAIQTSRSDCAMFSGSGYADIATGGGTYGNCVKDGGESGKFLPNTKLFANVVSGTSIIYSAPFDSTGTYRIPVLANGNYTIVITADKTSTSSVMPKLWSLSSGTGSYNITVSGGTTSSTIPTVCLKSCLYGSIVKDAYASSALGVNYWGGTPTGAQGAPDGNPSSIYYQDYQPYETKLTYSETFSAGDDLNITGKFYNSSYTGGIVLAFSVDGVNYTANSPTINGFNATNYDKITYTVPANLTGNYKYIRVRGAATNSLFLLDAIQIYSAQCALYIGSAYNDNGKGGGTYGNCTKDGTEDGKGLPYQSLYANFVKDDKVVFSSPLDSNGEYKAPSLVDGLYKVVITNTTTGITASFPTSWALSSGVGSANGTYTLSIQGGNKTSPTTVPSFCLKTCKGGTFNQLQYASSSTGVTYWGAVAANGATGAPDGIGLNVYSTGQYNVDATMPATFTGGDIVNVWLRQGPYVYAGYQSDIKMQFSVDGVSFSSLVGPYIATSATSSNKISYTIPSSVTSKYKYIRIQGASTYSLLIVDAVQTEHYECAMYSANTFNDNGDGGGTYANCTVDGTENGSTVPYTKLFANVVLNGQVVSSSPLKSDGSYSIPELPNGLYSVVITRFSTGITPLLPATWSFSNGVGFYWITVNSKVVTSPTTIPTICLKTCNAGVIDQLQYVDSSAGATLFGGVATGAKGAPDGIGANVYTTGTSYQLVTKFAKIFTGGDRVKIWGRNQPGYTDGIVLGFSEDGINYTINTGVIGGFNSSTYTAVEYIIPADFPAEYKYIRVQGNSGSTGIFIDAIQVNNIASLCAMYTGMAYNDDGKGAGTFGNCTQDGTEDGSTLPNSDLYANVVRSGEVIYSAKFTNNGTYSIPSLENGNYTVVITNSAAGKSPSLPALWQASTGILSYSITVSNGTVTSPTTIPKICLRSCQFGIANVQEYAAGSTSYVWWGASSSAGAVGAPDGISTNIYSTYGVPYNNVYNFANAFSGGTKVTFTARQYPGGYTGGIALEFSVDGNTYTSPVNVSVTGLNGTTFDTVSYTLPETMTASYRYIRASGTNTPATTALFVDAVSVSNRVCNMYKASAYNDNGQGGGTYGNCTKDGSEDGRTLPKNAFINLVKGDTLVVFSTPLDSLGFYSIPSVPNGTYKVNVANSPTAKTATFPNLWSMSSGTGSYTITVLNSAVTSPTTIPTFCLKTCNQGIALVDQYAAASNGVTSWGGTVNGGAGAPDANLTPVDGAPNNARATNVANSGTTNQAFFRYNTVFTGDANVTIRGRQYSGYFGGLRLAFSKDSISWTTNTASINGFSSTAYSNVTYTIPSNLLEEYKYIRIQGSDSPNTTLMYIDAVSVQTQSCAMYNASVFHDNGQGGGTYGNCTKDGTEDGTTLPSPMYVNVFTSPAFDSVRTITAAASSSVYSTLSPSVSTLTDNNAATGAATNSTANAWVSVDIGASRTINQIDIMSLNAAVGWGVSYMNNVQLQWSNDNTNWNTVATMATAQFSENNYTSYTFSPVTARYVRVFNSSGYAEMADIIVRYKLGTFMTSQKLDASGNYAIPTLANGTYTVLLTNSPTSAASTYPNLWSGSAANSYNITVSSGAVTSPTTFPRFCMKTCGIGKTTFSQYATASAGATNWGGTVNGGAGAPDANLTPVDGAPNNARATNIYTTGTSYQAIFTYGFPFRAGGTIKITGRQYAGYTGGIYVAFSKDGVNFTANSVNISGFNATAYNTISYTLPSDLPSDEFMYIRVQGSDIGGTTLMYLDAIEAPKDVCTMFKGTAYNDNGKGGGTYGNCTKDGSEDSSGLPAIFVNVVQSGVVINSQPLVNGSYSIPELPNGTYTVILSRLASSTTANLPVLWSSGVMSYSITVSGNTVTSPTTIPAFCLRTCNIGQTFLGGNYAATSTGVTNWGGTASGGSGAPDANLTPVDGAANNARATNIYTTGTTYQAIFNYNTIFKGGSTVKVYGRQYAGYTGGIRLAFSADGVNWTTNSQSIHGFNATSYTAVSYTVPVSLTDEYKFIRIQGSDSLGTTLMYIDAVETQQSVCAMYAAEAYNDFGNGGGTYGNCTKDGAEDGTSIPDELYANIVTGGAVLSSHKLDSVGKYYIPTLPNGIYAIVLTRFPTATTSIMPNLWSVPTGNYNITVSGGAVTSPTTIPSFCLRTCRNGQVTVEQFASNSSGVGQSWGGTTPGGGTGVQNSTFLNVYAQDNASYQSIFEYTGAFTAADKITIFGKHYNSSYPGGLLLAFSTDGVTYTSNTSEINGFNPDFYTPSEFEIPASFSGNYRFIRVRGAQGNTLMNINAIKITRERCVMRDATVYNDNGAGGGTYGNCTLDGSEASSPLPTPLYANVISGTSVIYSLPVDSATRKYSLPTLPNGSYRVAVSSSITDTVGYISPLWNYGTTTGKYSITVASDTITTPTTLPTLCMTPCLKGNVDLSQYAIASNGINQSWGGVPDGAAGAPNGTFQNVYAQDNASYQFVAEFNDIIKDGYTLGITAKQYPGYTGGLVVAFSLDGVTYTSNSVEINGFNSTDFKTINYTVPFAGEFKFVRVRGALGNSLLYVDAIKSSFQQCALYTGTAYSDAGTGGGTYGNCTRDGSESGAGLPNTELFANVTSVPFDSTRAIAAVSQSSVYAGVTGTPANMTDGNGNTGAATNPVANSFVSFDLGSVRKINYIDLMVHSTWGTSYIAGDIIQWSANGTTWTDIATLTSSQFTTGVYTNFRFKAVDARYVRVISPAANYVFLGDVRIKYFNDGFEASAKFESDGTYKIPQLADGTYKIVFTNTNTDTVSRMPQTWSTTMPSYNITVSNGAVTNPTTIPDVCFKPCQIGVVTVSQYAASSTGVNQSWGGTTNGAAGEADGKFQNVYAQDNASYETVLRFNKDIVAGDVLNIVAKWVNTSNTKGLVVAFSSDGVSYTANSREINGFNDQLFTSTSYTIPATYTGTYRFIRVRGAQANSLLNIDAIQAVHKECAMYIGQSYDDNGSGGGTYGNCTQDGAESGSTLPTTQLYANVLNTPFDSTRTLVAVSQTSVYAGVTGTVSSMTDGLGTTGAATNAVANSFVRFDLGSVRKINYIDLMVHSTWGTSYIAGDIIQWSADSITWNNIATLTSAQFTTGVYTNFRFPAVDARYVRVISPAANYVFLGDVRIKYFNDGYVFSAPVESDGTYNIPFLANGNYKVVMATSVTDTVNTLPDLWLNSSGNGTYNITVSNGAVTSPTTIPKFCLKTCERGSLNFDQFASSCVGATNWGGTASGGAGAPDGVATNIYNTNDPNYQAVLTYDKSFKGGTRLKITGRWHDLATYNRGIILAFSTDGVNYTANSPEINGFGYESASKYYTVDYVIPSSFTADYKYIRVRGITGNTLFWLDAIKVDKSYCKLYTGGAYNDAGTGGGTYGNCTKDGVEEGGSLPNSKLYANVISPNAIDSTYSISAVTYSSLYSAPFTPTVSNLTDKSSTTGGATNSTANSWISVDLGGSRTINYIDLMNVSTSPFNNSYMNNLQLQWSNDNTNWTTITTLATASFTDNVYSNYTFPSVTARYVRLLNPSGHTTLGDIRIKNYYDGILASAPFKTDGTYDIPNSFPDGNYKVIVTNSPGNNTTALPDGWSTSLSSFNITTSSGNVTSPTTIPEFCLKFCQYGQIDLSQYSYSATTTNPNWGGTTNGATGAPDGVGGSVYALNNASYQVYMRYADVFTGGQTLNITAKQYPGYTGGLLLEFSADSVNFTTSNMVVNGFTSADFTTISATIPASLTGSYKYIRVRGASGSTLSFVDAIQVGRKECAMYKGIVFNDNGKEGGTYGNCVQDGLEDGTSLPSIPLYANVVSSGSVIYSAPVDKFGEYLIPSSLANGSYIVVLALDRNATSPTLPYLWNYSSGNGSYTLNVSGGTNTSTVPKFCLKTCRYQTLDFSTYAAISSGATSWGGVSNGASGEPDGVALNVYNTGTTYQTLTQFEDSVTGGDIINIWGKLYSTGYFDGITVSFSSNGSTWTANSPTLNGMNANSFTKISYRLPFSLTGNYKYIRIQGVSGSTLCYIDAVQMEHYICQQLNPSVYLDNGEGGGTKNNCIKDGSESGFFTIPGRVFINAISGGNVVRSFPVSYANGIGEVYGLPDGTYSLILANSDTSRTSSYPYGYTSRYTPTNLVISSGEISNPSILPLYICLNAKDYDGDGIEDPIDLDLDNDGVLNATEYSCVDTNFVTNLVTNNVDGLYSASARFRVGSDSVRFTYKTSAFAGSNQLNATSNSGVHVSCYDMALPFTEQYTMVSDQNLRYNGRISWGPRVKTNNTSGVGNNTIQHQLQVTWSPANVLAKVVDPLGQTNMNDGEFIKSGKVFTQFAGTSSTRTWYLEFYTDNVSANFDLNVKHTGTGATWYSYGLNMSNGMCRSRNSDNDTLTNEFDYDSDNDACSDAFESGATGSQISNYKFTSAVGSNGYPDNLENTADAANPNFPVTYSKAITNTIKECSSLDCILVNPRLTYRLPQVDPAIASLSCSSANNLGSLSPGVAASGVSSSIPYTGGNGTAYLAQSVNSTGVTGLTATLSAGNFTTSTGSLTYNITGTPSGSGAAIFAINIGGQSCTLNRAVSTFALAGQGFENATGCIFNGSTTAVNALFPTIYRAYNSPVSGTSTMDVLGNCNLTYGTAMFGNKYVAISRGDAFTIDLGSNLTAGSTFTMTMYERLNTTLSSTPTSYRVGVSTAPGTTSASSNLFTTTGTTNTTWTPKTISFTVPAGTSWRYITVEATNTTGTPATLLDF